jgi:CBS domain-containing protein
MPPWRAATLEDECYAHRRAARGETTRHARCFSMTSREAENGARSAMKVGELCTRAVAIAHAGEHLLVAARRMRGLHVGCLVVVEDAGEGRRPVGIVTDRDLLMAIADSDPTPLEALCLSDVMTSDLITAAEDDDVADALDRMRQRGVRRLPVVDTRGVLLGILAYDDLVEWIGEQIGALARLVDKEQRREREARPTAHR